MNDKPIRKWIKVLSVSLGAFMLSLLIVNTALAAGEQERYAADGTLIHSFGAPEINGVTNDVYGPDGAGNYRLRSSNELISDTEHLSNANRTGVILEGSGYVRSVPSQRTHGEYKNNTNSCASCHQTHTASGKQLLFRNGIYYTCTACHDGTLGYLNVLMPGENIKSSLDENSDGILDSDKIYAAGAGTFAGYAGDGSSMHLAIDMVKISSAPGGNGLSSNIDVDQGSTWGATFSCSSCHSPHGSYSPRLLHYNPNNIANETPNLGGYKTVGVQVYSETINNVVYYYVGGNGNNDFLNRDKNPWLYGYKYVINGPEEYYTAIKINGNKNFDEVDSWNDKFFISYGEAYFIDPDSVLRIAYPDWDSNPGTIKIDIAPVLVVNMQMSQPDSNNVSSILNYGDASSLNNFCAACHTDYKNNNGDGSTTTGTFNNAYRHSTYTGISEGMVGGENKKMTCLTCHYAHGTTKQIQLRSDNSFSPEADVNISSAIKRYVNNGSCIKCHGFNEGQQIIIHQY